MTTGEEIRLIRKDRGLTTAELGKIVGVNESYIRAYESGRRHPKETALKVIANALSVNIEELKATDLDREKAMHRLFRIFCVFDGELYLIHNEETGEDFPAVSFRGLSGMRVWYERYQKYQDEVYAANRITRPALQAARLAEAVGSFDRWMRYYREDE